MKLWKLLLFTYLFSVLLSVAISFIFLAFTVKGQWDSHLVPLTFIGAFFLNLPLTFIEVPGLFMSISFKKQKNKAFVACLITPFAILGYVLLGSKMLYDEKQFYATQLISQIVVLCFMFFRGLTPNNIVEED